MRDMEIVGSDAYGAYDFGDLQRLHNLAHEILVQAAGKAHSSRILNELLSPLLERFERARYRDAEGDLCTLYPASFTDFISTAAIDPSECVLLKLEVDIVLVPACAQFVVEQVLFVGKATFKDCMILRKAMEP